MLNSKKNPIIYGTLILSFSGLFCRGIGFFYHLFISRIFGEEAMGIFQLTSPILMYLLESKLPVESITVMVQEEVAKRMQAKPGTKDYGALSLAVQYYAEAETLFGVSRGSFMPAPNVDSAVIRLSDKKVNVFGPVGCDPNATCRA